MKALPKDRSIAAKKAWETRRKNKAQRDKNNEQVITVGTRLRKIKKKAQEKNAPMSKQIREVCNEMAEFLIAKNASYGNSAAEPANIFARDISAISQIDVRIDDKINRMMKGKEYPGDDTVKDLTGYLLLRMAISKL